MTTKHLEFLPTYSPGNGKPVEILFPAAVLPEVSWIRGISFELLLIPDVFRAPDGETLNPIPQLPLEPQRLKLCHFRRLFHSLPTACPG